MTYRTNYWMHSKLLDSDDEMTWTAAAGTMMDCVSPVSDQVCRTHVSNSNLDETEPLSEVHPFST